MEGFLPEDLLDAVGGPVRPAAGPCRSSTLFRGPGRWLYILLFATATSALLTPLLAALAVRAGVVDTPGGRKIHIRVTPLLGGVAIMVSFISALVANMILDERDIALIAGGTLVALVGLIDDWKNVPARYKLIVQVVVVIFLIHSGIILDLFPTKTNWGYALNAIFSILWIVGLTNAMNFIDGMDGLAAGVSAIISLFMGLWPSRPTNPSWDGSPSPCWAAASASFRTTSA